MPRGWAQLPEPARLLAGVITGLAIGIAFEATSNIVWTEYIPLPDHGVCGDVLRWVGLVPHGELRTYIHHVPKRPPFPFDSSSPDAPRVHFAEAGQVHILCYPTPPSGAPPHTSRPVIALEDAGPADFDFLALDRLEPPSRRLQAQADEDALCQRLLQVGAKRWDSLQRFAAVLELLSGRGDPEELSMMRRGRIDPPTAAERAWTSGCVDGGGQLWMAKVGRMISGLQSEDEQPDARTRALLRERARVRLAATMPEKCTVLKRYLGARVYKNPEAALEEVVA